MDLKRILITDEISDKVIEALKALNLTVDYRSDISPNRIQEFIPVS